MNRELFSKQICLENAGYTFVKNKGVVEFE